MEQISREFLKLIVETPSPTGKEASVQKIWIDYITRYATSIETDIYGNAIAYKPGKTDLKIVLIGHSDEIGLMVTYITDEGFLRFDGVAPAGANVLKGQHVLIKTAKNQVYGVIGADDLDNDDNDDSDKNSNTRLTKLWVDIGAKNKEDAQKQVCVGDSIVIERQLKKMGEHFFVGQGLDGKIGIFVIAEILRKLEGKQINPELYALSSVQEEISSAGVKMAVYRINPQAAIVIDVTSATDYPSVKKEIYGDIRMGSGPVISIGIPVNNVLAELLKNTAQKLNIPVQFKAEPKYTYCDADDTFTSREGVATAVVSIPMRYTHTPVENVHLNDVELVIELIRQFLEDLPATQDFRPIK
ncbi:MAG: hypothetical protein A2161_01675 [Candidatus Schekmanbacteria bacterium RBG_13_48_7]|uniref:Endoglucanase n=1 Tax=Candidatus Schekmanbacteria bacterium RBG_13_48_7 TaxID=1817878 RepID=A0A1F7S0I4_9BACT|nr:MAG: hypothetical protein A2161_01675 [Candidatus Schekmanbacteria bacterium RBG_13_48_7]